MALEIVTSRLRISELTPVDDARAFIDRNAATPFGQRDSWVDDVVFGLLQSEWKDRRQLGGEQV